MQDLSTSQQLRRRVRHMVKRQAVTANKVLSRVGILVSPRHYYSSAPDLRRLAATRGLWSAPSELPGIQVDLDEQIAWLESACHPFLDEYRGNATYQESLRHGPGYGYVEAQALHGILRSIRPRRYTEVGGGVSTRLALHALDLNARAGHPATVTCVEPYPHPWLASDPRVRLEPVPVQAADLSLFTTLSEGDVLFVDSSHVVTPGSDVNFLVLEVFPRLAPGVLVHVHDIFLPYDYQRDLFETPFHWSETSLVRAFLTHNPRARILACLSHLHYARRERLSKVFPDYRPEPDLGGLRPPNTDGAHFPSSLWFQIR